MAGPSEIGIGVAQVLSSGSGPNPFPLSFRGQSVAEGAEIVVAVLDECADADISLESVELDPELYLALAGRHFGSVTLIENAELQCEVRFIRAS